jgi:hypothetical protein
LDCLASSIWEEARHEIFSGIQACERAQGDMVLLRFIGMALDLMEREAKLLGLDAETRNRTERPPERTQV